MSEPRITAMLQPIRAAYHLCFERLAAEDTWFEVGIMALPTDTPGVIQPMLMITAEQRGPILGGPALASVRVTALSGTESAGDEVVESHVVELLRSLRQGRSDALAEAQSAATAQPAGNGQGPDLQRLVDEYARGE